MAAANGSVTQSKRKQKRQKSKKGKKDFFAFLPFLPFLLPVDCFTKLFARSLAQIEIFPLRSVTFRVVCFSNK
jgi:hypothetical protein